MININDEEQQFVPEWTAAKTEVVAAEFRIRKRENVSLPST